MPSRGGARALDTGAVSGSTPGPHPRGFSYTVSSIGDTATRRGAVAVPARRRDQLEKVCRYVLRPPLAVERLTESTGGQLLYQFRRAWSDGSTALRLDPLELLERLAALVPPPRRPLLAYHGLLAPRARWRSAIVPPPAPDAARAGAGASSPRRWPWARLLHRVFAIQVLVCERGGGPRRILGAVTEPETLTHFRLRLPQPLRVRPAGPGRLGPLD